jgi:hypothetical protein
MEKNQVSRDFLHLIFGLLLGVRPDFFAIIITIVFSKYFSIKNTLTEN